MADIVADVVGGTVGAQGKEHCAGRGCDGNQDRFHDFREEGTFQRASGSVDVGPSGSLGRASREGKLHELKQGGGGTLCTRPGVYTWQWKVTESNQAAQGCIQASDLECKSRHLQQYLAHSMCLVNVWWMKGGRMKEWRKETFASCGEC